MKNKNNIYFALAVLIIVILFISSSETYKQQTSVPFLEKYLANKPFENWLSNVSFSYAGQVESVQQVGYFKFVEFFIRKAAHFMTYFLMAGFIFLGLKNRIKKWRYSGFIAIACAAIYASFDEFHQSLTGGRSPLVQDVILDTIGATAGVLLTILIVTLYHRRKTRKN
ncbi:VanZ family protein [Dellaglioa algida]|nr:VanZ family protein [Dellaglioa algida]MDK1727101.1 VanZ family protein [Dellaglioa algida]MDK1733453.1 VanZ family protein [Dellaglioa algida]MDK1734974.1 VanZ family protein [Dellaglioa algida]